MTDTDDDEQDRDQDEQDDGQEGRRNIGGYRVPQDIGSVWRHEPPIVAESYEAGTHWDVRLWRRGIPGGR